MKIIRTHFYELSFCGGLGIYVFITDFQWEVRLYEGIQVSGF